jgi:putative hydrolase of the HAD superfamily
VVLSNADSRLRKVFEGLNLLEFFEEIFLSTELGFEKPDTRAFRAVERFLKLQGDEILHVGDAVFQDGFGAKEAGWQVLLVNKPDSPFLSISSLQLLPEVLNRRNP